MDRGCYRAGFVLVGGRSSRMGSDKARLPWRGRTLVEAVAETVSSAAGSVTLIGDPDRYRDLKFAVIADERAGLGPLGGIATALGVTNADWNLITACDMPSLTAPLLTGLLEAAEEADADCLLPEVDGVAEPLCAVYHRRSLAAIREALDRGVRKVTAGLSGARVVPFNSSEIKYFRNINTPQDWALSSHG